MIITVMFFGQIKQIQARYVWQNAIKLKNIEQDLKESINKKIIFGLDDADKKKS